ncbi:MAG TPA: FAD-dependent oxidoreductase [Opitutaceae bacterium]|nr:FAD-dependent oxidoreductase [Opitutaceae bacterium]
MLLRVVALLTLTFIAASVRAEVRAPDVVVYGATPGGIMAAVSAARAGEHVLLLEPSYIVGGMMSGGLTKTDIGNGSTVGGLSREFFRRVKTYYENEYGAASAQARDSHDGLFFEPHVADLVFSNLLSEAGVDVRRKQRLVSAKIEANRITQLVIQDTQTSTTSTVNAATFIDASYEGDLLAAAHVPYRVGREARAEFNESLAGMTEGPAEFLGTGDHRVQSYNIRSTLTSRDDIRVPVPKPTFYNPEPHRHFIAYVLQHDIHSFEDLFRDWVLWGGINGKFDPNKADYVGVNYAYAEADPAARAAIVQRVRDYWMSLWWMLQNDPELPEDFKASARRWGLPKDEFVESGNVTPQLYVREARRMLGRYFLTQRDLELERHKSDAVCLGSYNIDSHDVQTLQTEQGEIKEGYLISSVDPWEIPYRSLTPYAPNNLLVVCAVSASHIAYGSLRMEPVFMMLGEVAGNAAQLARASSQPVQSIAIADLQARLTKAGIPRAAPYRPAVELQGPRGPVEVGERVTFKARVIEGKTPLRYFWNFDGSGEVQSTEPSPTFSFPLEKSYEVSLKVVDSDDVPSLVATQKITVGAGQPMDRSVLLKDAVLEGRWDRGAAVAVQNRRRVNYHDMNEAKGKKRAVFSTRLPAAGRYRVAFAFQGGAGRATNVPVTITHRGGETKIVLNERTGADPFALTPLGEFRYDANAEATCTVSNAGTDGYVSIDEVRWIWLGP